MPAGLSRPALFRCLEGRNGALFGGFHRWKIAAMARKKAKGDKLESGATKSPAGKEAEARTPDKASAKAGGPQKDGRSQAACPDEEGDDTGQDETFDQSGLVVIAIIFALILLAMATEFFGW